MPSFLELFHTTFFDGYLNKKRLEPYQRIGWLGKHCLCCFVLQKMFLRVKYVDTLLMELIMFVLFTRCQQMHNKGDCKLK